MKHTFSFGDLQKKLEFYFDHGKNVLLSGHKGIGKTAIIQQVFSKKTKNWLYFSASTMDPWVDFIGVPKEKALENGNTILEFIRPEYMNDQVEAIFVDEYNRGSKKIRNALMELIQFKSLNGKKFPNLKVIWAGVNPYNPDDDDNEIYDVEPIDPAQRDRFQIILDLPYAVDEEYFINKFGEQWAEGSLEWWSGLPAKIKQMVSPRRLDYALEVHQIGGDLCDVLPHESNPSKLLTGLNFGGIEKLMHEIFDKKDKKRAVLFLSNENNYQSVSEMLVQNQDWSNFFWPLLDEERQLATFFGNKSFQTAVFNDPIFYKSTLEMAEKNALCEPTLLRKVSGLLKKMRGVSLDSFEGDISISTLPGDFIWANNGVIGAQGQQGAIGVHGPTTISGIYSPSKKKTPAGIETILGNCTIIPNNNFDNLFNNVSST